MNACKQRLQTLPCDKLGYGYTSHPLGASDTVLHLMRNQGNSFPPLVEGQYFFVSVKMCDTECCETMRVIARDGDDLTVERTNPCDCISSNARVTYLDSGREYVQALAREIGLNVEDPLVYNCETNTLSLDCTKLNMGGDCGCGSGKDEAGVGKRGPQGERGADGKDGVSVTGITIDDTNTLKWTDNKGKTHTIGTIIPPQGQKGDAGPQGPQGPQGPAGPQGEDAGAISMERDEATGTFSLFITNGEGVKRNIGSWKPVAGVGIADMNVVDGNLEVTLTDGNKLNAGSTVGPRGPQGQTASFSMLYSNGRVYIGGPAKAEVYLRKNGAMLGGRQQIPDNGLLIMNNPNSSTEAVIELVHNGGVVALGYF